jgi:hypothetical protein
MRVRGAPTVKSSKPSHRWMVLWIRRRCRAGGPPFVLVVTCYMTVHGGKLLLGHQLLFSLESPGQALSRTPPLPAQRAVSSSSWWICAMISWHHHHVCRKSSLSWWWDSMVKSSEPSQIADLPATGGVLGAACPAVVLAYTGGFIIMGARAPCGSEELQSSSRPSPHTGGWHSGYRGGAEQAVPRSC